MLTAILAATYALMNACFADGSTLTGTIGTKYGQTCYYSVQARCASADGPCEARDRIHALTASMPQCQYVQPLAVAREAISPVER